MVAANTYGRQVVVPLTNKSGGGVVAGDVVILNSANDESFTTTTSASSTTIVGIAQETIANNATGRVLLQGYAALVNVNASVTRGHFGATHTVAKQATDVGSSRVAGTFAYFLTGGTTPSAAIYNPDLGGASLTQTNLGTTSVGGSNEGRAASTYWAKKVQPSTTRPIVEIRAHIKGNGTNIIGPLAAIFNDNSGAVGDLVAFCGMAAALYGIIPTTTYRWVSVPIHYIPAASTDIWIVFGVTINSGANAVQIAYAGSGTDRLITGTSAMTDGGWGSSTGNDYSIYAIQLG